MGNKDFLGKGLFAMLTRRCIAARLSSTSSDPVPVEGQSSLFDISEEAIGYQPECAQLLAPDSALLPRALAACAKLRSNLARGHTTNVTPSAPSEDFARLNLRSTTSEAC
jgi:hypothetical protein